MCALHFCESKRVRVIRQESSFGKHFFFHHPIVRFIYVRRKYNQLVLKQQLLPEHGRMIEH